MMFDLTEIILTHPISNYTFEDRNFDLSLHQWTMTTESAFINNDYLALRNIESLRAVYPTITRIPIRQVTNEYYFSVLPILVRKFEQHNLKLVGTFWGLNSTSSMSIYTIFTEPLPQIAMSNLIGYLRFIESNFVDRSR